MTIAKEVKPVDDLVKEAIKEAISRRRTAEGISTPVTPEERELIAPASLKVTELLEGQVWASSVFPKVFTKENDFGITVYKDEDWNEQIRAFIPDINPTYLLDKDHTEHILKGWEQGDKTLIYGPTGAGKSSIVQQLCAYVRRPFVRINATGDMDSSMIFGQQCAKDGATYWQDGTVTEAVKYGAVFAWDEWDVTPPEIGMGLQWLLEEEGKLFLKEMPGTSAEKFIVPDNRFRIVALGNTQGQGDDSGHHSGTNVQNTATLDRFGTVIRIGYMKEEDEIKMIKGKFPKKKDGETKALIKFANLIRQGYMTGQLNLTLSPRSVIGICKKVDFGYSLADATRLVYINKLGESHQKVAKELYRKIYGTKE